jgi:V/A-type H+-transporting ATPase subunit C
MFELKRYAYINARLRARLSNLLTDDFYNRLADCDSLFAAMALLKNTKYDFLLAIYEDTGDVRACENALYKREVDIYRDLSKKVEESLKPFLHKLTQFYEVDNLKNLLRLWFDHKVRGRDINAYTGYLFREKIEHVLPMDGIINADDMTEIISLLIDTPYMVPVAKGASESLKRDSLFPIELELDKAYYESLWESIETLPKKDRPPAKEAIGASIDLINLNTIVRLKHYFELDSSKILDALIAGGNRLNRNGLAKYLEGKELDHHALLRKNFPEYAALISSDSTSARDSLTFMETGL